MVAASSLLLGILFFLGIHSLTLVYVVLFVRALGETFHKPALQALIPQIVPQDELIKEGGFGQMINTACTMLDLETYSDVDLGKCGVYRYAESPSFEVLLFGYMRPIWAEMKREERSRRCMVSDGSGKIKRCENDCKSCERMKEGATLSLDAFFEENAFEFEDTEADECEIILTAMLFEDLLDKLRQQAPELTPIFEMLYDGKSQYAIAELIGKPQTTVNYMIKRMRTILQQHVSHEDLSM